MINILKFYVQKESLCPLQWQHDFQPLFQFAINIKETFKKKNC